MTLTQSDCGSVRHLATRTAPANRHSWRKTTTAKVSIHRIRERLEMRLIELGHPFPEQMADAVIKEALL
ncbi:MAG: hypothetical protein RLZZ32_1781 [Cyanobacteriota bacterium]|jgi:hypothetical protein